MLPSAWRWPETTPPLPSQPLCACAPIPALVPDGDYSPGVGFMHAQGLPARVPDPTERPPAERCAPAQGVPALAGVPELLKACGEGTGQVFKEGLEIEL